MSIKREDIARLDASETFHFDDLGELRDWLNRFDTTDLSTIKPDCGSHFV